MKVPGGRSLGSFLTDEEKANKPPITRALLRRIGSYLMPYWKQVVIMMFALLLEAALSLLPSILTGRIVDEGLIGKNLRVLTILILLSVGVILMANLISLIENYINTWISQHIARDMRNQMYRHMQAMSHRFFATKRHGDLITRMTSDINGVQAVMTNTFVNVLSNTIILMIAMVVMYRMNWILATVAILIVPLFSIPTKRVGKSRWRLTRESQLCNDETNEILNETLSVSGQLLVKLFTNEGKEFQKYKQANERIVKLNIREGLTGKWFRVAMNSFASIGPMLIYMIGGLLMMKYNQKLTVGDVTVMVALLGKMYQPLNVLMNLQVDLIRTMALFTRIFEYLDLPIEVRNSPNAVVPTSISGTLIFENVFFHYTKDRTVLKNINFDLKSGRSIAVVGPSGAGKSSLIQLIPRLYDVVSGRILLDGVDLRQIDLSFLRKNIGMVTQDTYLFNGTIRENLLYANDSASESEIMDACRKANLHDFILSLPDAYNTQVGNRGIKLSGGEKQRLSIARVILKDPPILIFDEATSSLDSISENLIQCAMEPLMHRRTSIVIAHRLSTIMAADEILAIDNGSIVERGAHDELVRHDGIYKKLYKTQFRPPFKGT